MREAVDAVAPSVSPARAAGGAIWHVRVVEELAAFLAEPDDPLLAALGEVARKAFPSPAVALAIDPDVDTLSLFIDARVSALRDRCGRNLSPNDDAAERRAIMADVEQRLARRYLRHLRAA